MLLANEPCARKCLPTSLASGPELGIPGAAAQTRTVSRSPAKSLWWENVAGFKEFARCTNDIFFKTAFPSSSLTTPATESGASRGVRKRFEGHTGPVVNVGGVR
jgi:hypothetical protein